MFGGIKAYVKSLYLLLNSAANPKLLLKKSFALKNMYGVFVIRDYPILANTFKS